MGGSLGVTTPTSATLPDNVLIPLENLETVQLSELRNWNLNVWEVQSHISYIYSMLQDFDLITRFQIN
jgi:hypothetical protein